MHAKYGYDGFGRRLWKLVKDGKTKPKLTVFSWDANLLTSEEVFEGEFLFWDTFAYPQEPELEPEDPSKTFSLPVAQRLHTLTARALKRTHWLYEPESFVPAAQLVDTYDQHAQRMTGTGQAAYSSTVSAASVTVEPQLYYIHTDHLGTPQELTDCNGQLHWVGHYRAWGELAKANDSEGNAANVEMPLRFQGQYCDAETGLHYNRFRYYDPQVGRFTTQDPISLAGGLNLYQYAPNPVQWVDPYGLTKNRKENCPFSPSDNMFSQKAPVQVTPGRRILEGQYVNDQGKVQPWTAHYDEYGRLTGRTDYNAGNKAQGIPDTHYHTYEWGPGKTPQETGSHLLGEYKP